MNYLVIVLMNVNIVSSLIGMQVERFSVEKTKEQLIEQRQQWIEQINFFENMLYPSNQLAIPHEVEVQEIQEQLKKIQQSINRIDRHLGRFN